MPKVFLSVLAGIMLCLYAVCIFASGQFQNSNSPEVGGTSLKMDINGNAVIVKMNDNPAAVNLMKILPLEIDFRDYNGTEKIAELPEKLKVGNSPTSFVPVEGSFAYFIPWGNLAIFYRDFRHSNNLVPLGKVISGMEILKRMNGKFRAFLVNNTSNKD